MYLTSNYSVKKEKENYLNFFPFSNSSEFALKVVSFSLNFHK